MFTCPDCRASATIAGAAVRIVHRWGCPFALALLECEETGKPIVTVAAGRVVKLETAVERPS